jgi:hypothetical protein
VPGERYVLLGLAPARTEWFEAVARWATSAAIAAEFTKCVSAEEVRSRLASGRRYSALIVDTSTPSFDRDLVDLASGAATPVILVKGVPGPGIDPVGVGAVAELSQRFARAELEEVLARSCATVGGADSLPAAIRPPVDPLWLAPMITVCGPGGTGASSIAMALAQGLGTRPTYSGEVLLADLDRRADQAMFHDATDLGPGLQELVEAHRVGQPDEQEIRRMTFAVHSRGYRLLLGLRRPEAWSALRPRAVELAIDGVRSAFGIVVADVAGDFEGETDGGSMDVEERNHLARAAALHSSVIVAVGLPGLKGVHSLARLVRELTRAGVAQERVLTVINRSPRNPRARAESARALGMILSAGGVATALASPVAVPERKLEDHMRSGAPLPDAVVEPVTLAALAVAGRLADAAPPVEQPSRIEPGTLGSVPPDDEGWQWEETG